MGIQWTQILGMVNRKVPWLVITGWHCPAVGFNLNRVCFYFKYGVALACTYHLRIWIGVMCCWQFCYICDRCQVYIKGVAERGSWTLSGRGGGLARGPKKNSDMVYLHLRAARSIEWTYLLFLFFLHHVCTSKMMHILIGMLFGFVNYFWEHIWKQSDWWQYWLGNSSIQVRP